MSIRPVQTLWLGPGRHFVHYPISRGRWVNVVAIVPAGEWRTGAAQAIEDAFVLAACLRDADRASEQHSLQRYEALRRPRTSQVQLMSRGREVRNHLPDGPEQEQRDAGLADGDPLRQSAWLYGHDVEAEASGG